MKKMILSLPFIPMITNGDDLVRYRLTLDVSQRPVSVQEMGFGGTQTNKANVVKTVSLRKETVISAFDDTARPEYGKFFDSEQKMRKDIVMYATPADEVSRCSTDNLSWPFKSLLLGMTHRDNADLVLLDGVFRSEKIYDCSNQQRHHTYTQETEQISLKIKMENDQVYVHTFSNTRIPTKLIIERIQ